MVITYILPCNNTLLFCTQNINCALCLQQNSKLKNGKTKGKILYAVEF